MTTTYQEIWNSFVDICNIDTVLLPQEDEGKYILINSGARHYNSVIDESETVVVCNNLTENISIKLSNNKLLLLVNCMKRTYLENELLDFTAIWSGFSEVGVRDFRSQVSARQRNVDMADKEIGRLLDRIDSMSFLGDI